MSDMLKLAAALDNHAAAIDRLVASNAGDAPTKTRKPRATAEAPAEAVAATPTPAATVAAQTAQSAPATPAAVAAPAASAPASAANGGPTLQRVADAIIDLANTVSREAAVSVLSKYEAGKVPQLRPADFQAVLADVAILKSGGVLPPKGGAAGAGLM